MSVSDWCVGVWALLVGAFVFLGAARPRGLSCLLSNRFGREMTLDRPGRPRAVNQMPIGDDFEPASDGINSVNEMCERGRSRAPLF